MKKILALCLFLICAGAASAWARDEFSDVRCGADIPKALIGKSAKNEPDMVKENRHKDIGLNGGGTEEVSDSVFVVSWTMCGKKYDLLYKRNTISDVLPTPAPDEQNTFEFLGYCKVDGKEVPGFVYGVMAKDAGTENIRPIVAWKIDERRGKFVIMSVAGLSCPFESEEIRNRIHPASAPHPGR